MNKNTFEKVTLSKGEMHIYDFGAVKLHAYQTKDLIDDEVLIVEKNGQAVMIESPCFFDNEQALIAYFKEKNIRVTGMLLAYHMAGGAFLPDVPKYATKNADAYGHNGGGAALIQQFTSAFGTVFDHRIHQITEFLSAGTVQIGGIHFEIQPTVDAFDIVIPEINAVYTHMLGHDCHSIVAGVQHADSIIAQLQQYLAEGRTLILTSHYTPEDLKDVKTKIDYLQQLKIFAQTCADRQTLKAAVQEKYPDYTGENYLDMTVNMFFN